MSADGAPLGRLLEPKVQVVLLAVHLPVHVVERLPTQRPPATHAHEAARVVQVAQGLARRSRLSDALLAARANTQVRPRVLLLRKLLLDLTRQLVKLLLSLRRALPFTFSHHRC